MPVSTALALAPSAIQLGKSAIQSYKAKKIAKSNVRPDYVPSTQIQENRDLAASLAGTGLSDSTKALYGQQNERNLSQSLGAILRSGGSGNQISDLYANNNDALMKLNSMDAEMQRYNISQYLQTNKDLAQENQTQWQVNEYGPYADKAQLAGQLRLNSQENLGNGLSGLSKTASNYFLKQLYSSANKDKVPSKQNIIPGLSNTEAQPQTPYLGGPWAPNYTPPAEQQPQTQSDRFLQDVLQSTNGDSFYLNNGY